MHALISSIIIWNSLSWNLISFSYNLIYFLWNSLSFLWTWSLWKIEGCFPTRICLTPHPFYDFNLLSVFTFYSDTPGFSSVSPTKSGQIHRKDAQWAEINEKSIISFWDMVDFVLKILSELGTYSFRTCFRNDNQWYPITSWLREFNPKIYEAWGPRPDGGVEDEASHVPRGWGGRRTFNFLRSLWKYFCIRFRWF